MKDAAAKKILATMRTAAPSISFAELLAICVHFFGEPRQKGTSHAVFRTPWPGDPRVNIQRSRNGMAKVYQVRQVVKAIDKLQEKQP